MLQQTTKILARANATGRASVYLRLGFVATDAVVTVVAPSLDDSVQARITVKPGHRFRTLNCPVLYLVPCSREKCASVPESIQSATAPAAGGFFMSLTISVGCGTRFT